MNEPYVPKNIDHIRGYLLAHTVSSLCVALNEELYLILSAAYVRVNATVQQFPEVMQAYGVKEGDTMYLAEKDRINVW